MSTAWDHPRGRGGNWLSAVGAYAVAGPSPRARGKLADAASLSSDKGTIPAGAGETSGPVAVGRSRGDHPRGRGGNCQSKLGLCRREGPSPRARGKLKGEEILLALVGTIPAGAGETTLWTRHRSTWWDHPRGRGGNRPGLGCFLPSEGPSPRARGKPRPQHHLRLAIGTIPAGAGETVRVFRVAQSEHSSDCRTNCCRLDNYSVFRDPGGERSIQMPSRSTSSFFGQPRERMARPPGLPLSR